MFTTVLSALCALCDGFFFLRGYVAGTNAFPMPLSPKEEAELLLAMERGDEKARNILVERNLRLVAHIVKKFDNTYEETDDLISIGTIGLIKAIRTFDRHKNTRLATYAARCIENEILMHLRANRRVRSEMMLFDPIGADKEGNEIALIDILEADVDIEGAVAQAAEREAVQRKMQVLSRRERRVIELRYGLAGGVRKTQREISKALGISRSYVSRIEKRAITKLQNAMAAEGYQ